MENIRAGHIGDAPALAAIEAACFPAAEAADEAALRARLTAYPACFYILEEDGVPVGFINGPVINSRVIEDEMYADTRCHNPAGAWQSVFGLDVLPQWRRNGRAARLMRQLIRQAKDQGRKGCVLTCKEALIPYYQKFGYRCGGVSQSVHGGAVWYDMLLEF